MNGDDETREIELKLTFDDPGGRQEIMDFLAARGYKIESRGMVRNDDLYMDTGDWKLLSEGLSLRLRRANGEQSYTLKSIGTMENGLADRLEIETPIRNGVTNLVDVTDERLRKYIDPVIYPRKLVEQVFVRTERWLCELTSRDGSRVELAFDASEFRGCRSNERRAPSLLYELEAELVEGTQDVLSELSRLLIERFGCRPSPASKLETAMERLRIEIPPNPSR